MFSGLNYIYSALVQPYCDYRRVPIVATLVTFGEQKSCTNRAGASFFSDGIDGLPDYCMGESADIEEIEFFTDSEVER